MNEIGTTDRSSTIASWLLQRTKGVRTMWAVSVCSRIINQILMIAVLVLAGQAVLGRPLIPTIWLIVLLSFAKAALRYLEQYAGHWVAFTMLAWLRTEFYHAIVPQAPAVVKGSAAAELSERATRDIDRVEVFFAHTIPPAVAALVVPLVSTLWVGIYLDWALALPIAIASLLMGLGPVLMRCLSWGDSQNLAAQNARIATHLGDTVQGLSEVLSFEATKQRITQWKQEEVKAEHIRSRIRRRSIVRAGFLLAIELFTMVLLVAYIPSFGIEASVVTIMVWIGLWTPLRGVDDFVDGLDEALASAERVRAGIEQEPLVVSPLQTQGEVSPGRLLEIEDVTFHYDSQSEEVLNNVNLKVDEGTWTYVAGVSGGGKSTLAALLARGWDPSSGSIRYAGRDLKNYTLDELREKVKLVVQRPWLLADTLAANLRLSVPSASEEELWESLDIVEMKEWAQSLPEGLDQQIFMDGDNLSGGQIQRLALARALVSHPEFLILDEAMSQLDEETAALVRQRVRERNMTVMEISHQVDQIPSEAEVIVIDAGLVVERGEAGFLRKNSTSCFSRLSSR